MRESTLRVLMRNTILMIRISSLDEPIVWAILLKGLTRGNSLWPTIGGLSWNCGVASVKNSLKSWCFAKVFGVARKSNYDINGEILSDRDSLSSFSNQSLGNLMPEVSLCTSVWKLMEDISNNIVKSWWRNVRGISKSFGSRLFSTSSNQPWTLNLRWLSRLTENTQNHGA